ncbi:hypothetical protein CspHIS471_0400680 [Cutaneotrichosporon sp. HIS471]|nr:hypothetical protein CspHIS471_0400680 [Cutaneotrichosporon sp. HIS471]
MPACQKTIDVVHITLLVALSVVAGHLTLVNLPPRAKWILFGASLTFVLALGGFVVRKLWRKGSACPV